MSFLITAVVRLDSSNIGQWRDRLLAADVPKLPLAERLEAATNAIREVSHRILMPAVVVADSTGTADKALPLLVKVTNFAPNTEIILTGLAVGTTLTSGNSIGAREWRINIVDLPNAHVVPPQGYSGLMTLVAELRDGEGYPLSRAPLHLKWNAAAEAPWHDDNNAAIAAELPVTTLASADDLQNERLSVQSVDRPTENVVLPKPRPIKHASFVLKTSKPKKQMAMKQGNKHRMSRPDLNTGADTRWASGQLPPHGLIADSRVERQQTLERIFRGFFDNGRHANNCASADSRRQLRGDCDGRQ